MLGCNGLSQAAAPSFKLQSVWGGQPFPPLHLSPGNPAPTRLPGRVNRPRPSRAFQAQRKPPASLQPPRRQTILTSWWPSDGLPCRPTERRPEPPRAGPAVSQPGLCEVAGTGSPERSPAPAAAPLPLRAARAESRRGWPSQATQDGTAQLRRDAPR